MAFEPDQLVIWVSPGGEEASGLTALGMTEGPASGMATWQAINLMVLRLEPRGTLDKDFVVTNGFAGQVRAIAVKPDGKILLGGTSQRGQLHRGRQTTARTCRADHRRRGV